MKKILGLLFCGLAVSLLSGCASIVNGVHQSVSVQTRPVEGANCRLQNTKGTWFVRTPGSVMVHQSISPLHVTCHKHAYFGQRAVGSHPKAMVAGNLVFGGVIGAGVDAADGAAFAYPALMTIRMYKRNRHHG